MVIYHSTPTLNLLLTPMEKWKRQSQKQKFQKCLQLIIWKTKVLLSFLRVRGHIDICFFCLKIDKITNHFHENGRHWNWFDSGASLLNSKYIGTRSAKKRGFYKIICPLLHISILYDATGNKIPILIYISILKAIRIFSRFVLSHFWKNICLDKTKHAKLYCKQKLKKSIILHLQKCTTNSISKNKITKKNTYLYYK